jgi:hypothetical protein
MPNDGESPKNPAIQSVWLRSALFVMFAKIFVSNDGNDISSS